MIEVKNLSHDYEGKGKLSVDDISFSIEPGTIFGFLGPSGAGKSTTQQIMIGLLALQKGSILYDGKTLKALGKEFFETIGVSFEHPNLFGKLTGLENLTYHAGLYRRNTLNPKELLEMVGLADSAHKRASAYSKGMKQRLVFARSLINNPTLLFLDEPTSGLDPATAQRIKGIIKEKRDQGATVFLTTHNMASADELCDTVAFLNAGKIVAMDSPRNLKLQYGQRSVVVEYTKDKKVQKEILFPQRTEDSNRLKELMDSGTMETIHSQEASLEDIFIKLTGRGLG